MNPTNSQQLLAPAPAAFTGGTRTRSLIVGAVIAGLLILPFFLTGYLLFQATQVVIYAIAILGLNLVTGYNGQISLGHGAFYAVGGYVVSMLMERVGVPYWVTIFCCAGIGFLVGYLFGKPALRLEGLYLAMATFALAIATPQLIKWRVVEKWTGGVQGIVITSPEPPAFMHMSLDQWLYGISALSAVLLFVLARHLLAGKTGRALEAIRDHPLAAKSMGIDTAHYKAMIFGISAMYTAIAGGLAALLSEFVAPDTYNMFLSITLLVGVIVGGQGSVFGAVPGAIYVVFMPNLAEKVSKAAPWAIYGVSLILFMYLMPNGVAGLAKMLQRRSAGARGNKDQP